MCMHRPKTFRRGGARVDQDPFPIPLPRFETREITMPTTDRPSGSVLEQPTPSGRLARRLAIPERYNCDGLRWVEGWVVPPHPAVGILLPFGGDV